jgi:hypothetical protein
MGFNVCIAQAIACIIDIYHNLDLAFFQITQIRYFMAKILQIALLQNIKIHKVET